MAILPHTELHAPPSTNGETSMRAARASSFGTLPLFASLKRAVQASPLLAQTWVDAIFHFWETGLVQGDIDPAKPLYVLDLAPGDGQFLWMALQAIGRRLSAFHTAIRPCYIACCHDADEAGSLLGHPCLSEYVAHGWLDATSWSGQAESGLALRTAGVTLLRTDNPVAAIGLGAFASLPSDLFATHYDCIYEASTTWIPQDDADGTARIEYAWQPLADEGDRPDCQALFAHYRKHFPAAPLMMPTNAMERIAGLARLSGERYLLLAADPGVSTDLQVRFGALRPPEEWHPGDAVMPVNFHALSLYQQQHGAWVGNRQLADSGIVVHAAWCHGDVPPDDVACAHLSTLLDRAHPDDLARLTVLSAAAATSPPAASLSLLRLSQYDPAVLESCIDTMLEAAHTLDDTQRDEWRSALAATWANYLPGATPYAFYRQVGLLAGRLGDHGLAKDAFGLGLSLYGGDPFDLYWLACHEAASSDVEHALHLLDEALKMEPSHPHCRQLRDELITRLQRTRSCDWHHLQAAHENDLSLEPLGPEHASALYCQYRDPQIAYMTRLPDLQTFDDVVPWMAKQADEPGRMTWAIMHARWGFVGAVSLQCHADAAYFYFWIGADYQGAGYGRQAAALALRQAVLNGVSDVYTSALEANTRSINALQALGFMRIDILAAPPDDNLLFFHLPLAPGDDDIVTKLLALCAAVDNPLTLYDVFAVPEPLSPVQKVSE